MVDFFCGTESLVYIRSASTSAVGFLNKSIAYLNLGRTRQIRTGDLYRAKALITRQGSLRHN